jgi:signal transduction histidine kinase
VAAIQVAPELADAAHVLSDQLMSQLRRLAALVMPHAVSLDRRFDGRLRALKYNSKQRTALAAITSGAAARIFAAGSPALDFIEQVEYNGRRLAKLAVAPSAIATALNEYDRLLTPLLRTVDAVEHAKLQRVREQLQFGVILTLNNAYYQVREAETQAFYELFRVELESRNLDDLLHRFMTTLKVACAADAARLYLLDDERVEWVCRAADTVVRKPLSTPNSRERLRALSKPKCSAVSGAGDIALDPRWSRQYQSCWSVPLLDQRKTIGVMQFGFRRCYDWLPREQELLAAAAERCVMAAEKARLMEDLARGEQKIRSLAGHMLHVEEVERRRISRELHDEAGQSLLCIRLQMEMLEQNIPDCASQWKSKLRDTRDLTERTILEMRRLIAALSPAVLEQLGLAAALRQLINRFRRVHPCRVRLQIGNLGRLPQNTEIIVYRLLQECCNNIGKHSSATNVNISIGSADGMVKVNVDDNGVGFDVEQAFERRDSFGLAGMRERVALLGGRFMVLSSQRSSGRMSGTRITIELPISRKDGQSAAAS